MSFQLICAEADGVGPAALLTLNGEKGPQVQLLIIIFNTLTLFFIPAGTTNLPKFEKAVLNYSGVQYLFNVPEGFSRLVLEHKIRPGSKLRCAFATHSPEMAMVHQSPNLLHPTCSSLQLGFAVHTRRSIKFKSFFP